MIFYKFLSFVNLINCITFPMQNKINTIATYYFRIGPNLPGCPLVQTFNNNKRYGPCNFNGTYGVTYTAKSKYWAAIKNARLHCGKNIIVNYKKSKIILKIMDECPGCAKDNRIDMSLDALVQLTSSKENACGIHKPIPKISWKFLS